MPKRREGEGEGVGEREGEGEGREVRRGHETLTLEQEVTAEGEKDERLRGIWELTGRSKVKS